MNLSQENHVPVLPLVTLMKHFSRIILPTKILQDFPENCHIYW